ncbi:MAG: DUF5667 domain-containing protein [bacterium]
MEEKELINSIRSLKEIKPENEWVALCRGRLFGTEEKAPIWHVLPHFNLRLAVIPGVCLSLLAMISSASQSSLPGDLLYPVKRATEEMRTEFVSEGEKANVHLEMANRRVDELAKIAENNQVEKLATALNELKTTKEAVKDNVTTMAKNKPSQEMVKVAKEIAVKLDKVNKKETEVMAILGIEAKENEQTAEKAVAELLIEDAEQSLLTETQTFHLEEAKRYFSEESYKRSLEEILLVSYPQP